MFQFVLHVTRKIKAGKQKCTLHSAITKHRKQSFQSLNQLTNNSVTVTVSAHITVLQCKTYCFHTESKAISRVCLKSSESTPEMLHGYSQKVSVYLREVSEDLEATVQYFITLQ